MTEPNRIRVVSAAIIHRPANGQARVLLGQRGPTMDCPYKWCTPGGKVDGDETDEQALRRELGEELDLTLSVEIPASFVGYYVDPPLTRRPIYLRLHIIDVGDLALAPKLSDELIGLGWFTADDMPHLDLCPADDQARGYLATLLRNAS